MIVNEQDLNFGENRNLVKSIIDSSNKNKDSEKRRIHELEVIFLSLKIRNGKVNFYSEKVKDLFNTQESTSLLKEKVQSNSNLKLKLRYSYLLWNSPIKHNMYLDSIFDITMKLKCSSEFTFNTFDNYLIVENFTSLYYNNPKYIEKCFDLIDSYLSDNKEETAMYRLFLLECIRDCKKFNYSKLARPESYLNQLFDNFIEKHLSTLANRVLDVALYLSQQSKLDVDKWYNKTAKLFERHADIRTTDEHPLISLKSYIKAKEFYQKAKNINGAESTEVKINELKKRKILSKVPGLGMPEDIAQIKYKESYENGLSIVAKDTDEIFDHLFNLKNGLSDLEIENETSLADEFNVFDKSEFDSNRNIYDRGQSSNQVFDNISLLLYSQEIQVSILPILDRLIIDGFLQNKLNASEFYNQLAKRTWLSTSFADYTMEGVKKEYCWLETIKPSIYYLFELLESVTLEKGQHEYKIMLVIDSLSLKFEGLFRQILHSNNKPTTKKVRTGSQEKTLENFLGDEFIKTIFSNKELTFIKYVLTRQGVNIRNNVSHAYFKSKKDYSWNHVLLLLLVLLIIASVDKMEST